MGLQEAIEATIVIPGKTGDIRLKAPVQPSVIALRTGDEAVFLEGVEMQGESPKDRIFISDSGAMYKRGEEGWVSIHGNLLNGEQVFRPE